MSKDNIRPGDVLVVVHAFQARSPDELSLTRGDRIELIERDDDFGDGWYLGKNTESGESGLFPEVYTRPIPNPQPPLPQLTPHPSAEPRPLQPSSQLQDSSADRPSSPPSSHGPIPASTSPSATSDSLASSGSPDAPTEPLQYSNATSAQNRASLSVGQPRSISMTLSGDVPLDGSINSPVMHETLSVIDEHITDMSTPRQSTTSKDMRNNSLRGGGDSGSEYSSRLSYINGQETEEEESNLHTEEEVMSWSPARVAEYLEDVGVDKKHCAVFKEQEINGEVLLGMDQATIFLKEFELGPVGPRLRTWLKIKALQQEVKDLKDARTAISAFDGSGDPAAEQRNRATSMSALLPRIPSLSEGSRGKPVLRASSTATQAPVPLAEATSPLIQNTPVSPVPGLPPSRPSAASVRELSHNRRHSSIDQTTNPPFPTKSHTLPTASSHKKIPSFDRNWIMGSPQQNQAPEPPRPSSSNHAPTGSINAGDGDFGVPSIANDLDRGYFSGGEVENRKSRNVLRKREGSTGHARQPSYGNDSGRATPFNKRHSRVGSTGSVAASGSPVSPAAKQYYGASIKSQRSTGTFDFIRPLKQMNEGSPTVTKLSYQDSPSIDAIANSPGFASETSSLERASPSPAHHSHSFFGKKSKNTGLRAISDAITGGEKANASSGQLASPAKDSPLQSPARTGSTTPSGTSANKSLELENSDLNKSFTSSTSSRRKSKKETSAYRRGREKITPAEAIANCDYSGWMKKKSSSLMTTWKTRLFVLRGRRLSYFYSENDTEEKGLIDISSHRVLPANNERITGLHAALTRAGSTPTSPHDATIPTNASSDSRKTVFDQDVSGMFIFKLVPPRAGLQKGVQFTKPIVHYFAVDNIQLGRLWMAALMKATIDRDDSVAVTMTYQQKTISLEKARAMRQRPPALMDDRETGVDGEGEGDGDGASTVTAGTGHKSARSVKEDVIHEEDEMLSRDHGLAISGLDDAKALLDFAEGVDGDGDAGLVGEGRREKRRDVGKEGDLNMRPPRSSGSGREKEKAVS